ncbi:hypothetical protein Tco_1399643, partial [Tanacetum coccineum]
LSASPGLLEIYKHFQALILNLLLCPIHWSLRSMEPAIYERPLMVELSGQMKYVIFHGNITYANTLPWRDFAESDICTYMWADRLTPRICVKDKPLGEGLIWHGFHQNTCMAQWHCISILIISGWPQDRPKKFMPLHSPVRHWIYFPELRR